MDLSQDGFTVCFGGADTIAPPNVVVRGAPASLTVGVTPAHPMNAVDILYQVDDGLVQTLSAWELRTDYNANIQYFRATFPKFVRGSRVDYCPVAHCAGGVQVPAPGRERELTATFALADAAQLASPAPMSQERREQQQFHAGLVHVATARFELEPPFVFGETPEGFHAAFHVEGGTSHGESLAGAIKDDSVVELRVRGSGVAIGEMHLTALTERGEWVSITLKGKIDFGASGYEHFVHENRATGMFEMMAAVETGARDLEGLNRASFLAVGCFDLTHRVVTYDLLQTKAAKLT